jgi:hypothetical protein
MFESLGLFQVVSAQWTSSEIYPQSVVSKETATKSLLKGFSYLIDFIGITIFRVQFMNSRFLRSQFATFKLPIKDITDNWRSQFVISNMPFLFKKGRFSCLRSQIVTSKPKIQFFIHMDIKTGNLDNA